VEPRVVMVTRPTGYEGLLARHGTHGQAKWFLERQGLSIEGLQAEQEAQVRACEHVWRAIPSTWRQVRIDRADLDRFLFEPEDLVVAVGQDGLVANVAKYLDAQAVIGVNPGGYDGVLVRHTPQRGAALLVPVAERQVPLQQRTRVQAMTDDGQKLLALNEIYLGHRTHQSSRYTLSFADERERQSSSGLIVATGTGATGWARSIATTRGTRLPLPEPTAPQLVFFVREAWPSKTTGATVVEGLVDEGHPLVVACEMHTGGVCFGDGIESDLIELPFARKVTLQRASSPLWMA
jgi:hypothetical protein